MNLQENNNDVNVVIKKNDSNVQTTKNVSLLVFNNNKKNQSILIPEYKDYIHFDQNKYTLVQLKQICKYLKLKVTGKKDILFNRIYDSLKRNYFAIKIQSLIRKIRILKFFKIKKKYSWKKYLSYINETDLYNLEPIKDIDFYNFFGFTDENNNSFGFSLYDLDKIISNTRRNNNVLNPYNKSEIQKSIIDDFKNIYKMSQKLNFIKSNKKNIVRQKFNIKYEIIDLFQYFDDLGNYTNINWFLQLNKVKLIRYYKELMDIWNYRANLTMQIKREICPPHGNPFTHNPYANDFRHSTLSRIQEIVYSAMCNITKNSINEDRKILGTFYVLSALTLVSEDAANSMPWLYQSVS
jgi:hypothetical protein